MLILSRKEGERLNFYIDGVLVASLLIKNATGRVQIGLDLSDSVTVIRSEIDSTK